MAVNKLDPKIIFASEAPAQDVPAVFTNKTVGWGESRKNGGRPTIKQSNALQQETDLKILWLNENAVTPYDATIDYPVNAVTIKDGAFEIFNGSVWNTFLTKSSVGLGNVGNTSDLDKPISTATQDALNGKASISSVNSLQDSLALKAELSLVKRGIGNTYDPTLTYNENERVILLNGDTVQSNISNNTNNPNTNMTGWKPTKDSNIDTTVDSISDLTTIQNPKDGQVVYVKKTDSHFIFYDGWKPNIINEINLSVFPRLAIEADDTGRFIRANQAVKMIVATDSPSGVTSVTTTHIYIPFGEYIVSDAIEFNPYVHVISDDMPTIKQTAIGKDIFVFREAYGNCVHGIRFFKGRYPISFSNSNLDETMLKVDNCEFHRSESYAIYTIGLTESQHMSAFIDITNCKFSLCNKIFHNVCDKALLQNSWVYLFLNNFESDSAAILNRGQLSIDTLIGVPNLGSNNPVWGESRVPNTRWIDNYGVLNCYRCRFGLEADGLTIVHSFGGAQDLNQGMGSTITLRECQISGGDKTWLGDGETGVIRIRAKMPKKIIVEDCNFQYNTPLIVLNQNYDFLGYLDTLVSDPKDLASYLKENIVISAKNNERNFTVPIVDIPSILSQFVNGGSGLTPHKVTISGTDTYFSYNMPIGANGALYELNISGNTNPDGSSLYSYSTKYNLQIGTGFNGSQVSFYAQGEKESYGATPASIIISGADMAITQFFGDGLSGSDVTHNNGIRSVRYVTLKISNSKEVKVSANLLSIH